MIERQLSFKEADLEDKLLPLLLGQAFHVTSRGRYKQIVASGAILPDADGTLGNTYPQSAASFARKNAYVCLFDLRHASEQALSRGLQDFYFLAPPPLMPDLSFLLVSSDSYHDLIQWDNIKKRVSIGAFRVPEIECWYAGPLAISAIASVLNVQVIPRPVDPNGLSHLSALTRKD